MEKFRLRVLESDEAARFEMAVNAVLADLEREGCAYEVSASVDGYFYKAIIKHAVLSLPVVDPVVDDPLVDVFMNRARCCHCSYYQRVRGQCLYFNKPVEFAGNICEHFKNGEGA